jgi:preprotein translocase subunit SecG
MTSFLIVLHVIICVLLVITVLLQFGKGAEMGAVMGSGSSQAVFSSSAKGNFMTKLTSFLAIGFMVNSILLTTIKSREAKKSLFDNEAPVAAPLNSDAQAMDKKAAEATAAATTETKTEAKMDNTAVPPSAPTTNTTTPAAPSGQH